MKIKAEAGDAVELAMDWLAQLHDDGCAEPQRDTDDRPAVAAAPPTIKSNGRVDTSAGAEITERAPIGDELRIPIAWCEMGSCISHHTDPVALGEADIRARAIAAGWRVDALSRLACPKCQQSVSWFWTANPVALWDRDRAVAMATLVAAAVYEDATSDGLAGTETGEISAVQPATSPWPARGRHRARHGRSSRAAERRTLRVAVGLCTSTATARPTSPRFSPDNRP
ncbi:MAG TPA: hypothetical protein DHU96_14510 [Actinobacteria bacterium]|nr:hypothetical protein [Actinomycetota bacterium]